MRVVKEKQYECDYCKKVSIWKRGWTAVTFWLGDTWEHEFHVCSDKCYWAIRKMKIQKRRQLASEINKKIYANR